MNNNMEVIGIDHGWSQMKTSNTCFNTSVKELANAPAFHDNVLEYDDRYLLWCGFHLSMQSAVSAYLWGFVALCLFIFSHKKA